jgi:hypothetical protein
MVKGAVVVVDGMMSIVGLLVGMVVGCRLGWMVLMRPARNPVPVSVVAGVVTRQHTSKWVVLSVL